MGIIGDAIALTIGTLLPIMNPFSTLPLFMSLTSKADERSRNRVALWACLYALILLVSFLLLGTAIIDFFGISVPGIRIAGGLIISVIGFRMLFPNATPVGGSNAVSLQEHEIAFTPLAMPSLAGPGSLSVVVTAASQIESKYPDHYLLVYAGVLLGMVVSVLMALAVLRSAGPIERAIGPSGIDAMTRIFGFLLIAIGIQFLLTGVSDFFGLAHI
jgi:multiple antibiotic resistance protein